MTKVHMLVEKKGNDVRVKCGKLPKGEACTVWHTDVTCPACRALTPTTEPVRRKRKRLVPRR